MTTSPGSKFDDAFLSGLTPGLAANLPATFDLPTGQRGYIVGVPAISGSITEVQPISIQHRGVTGRIAATFADDWFNKIHIRPQLIDMGAVSGGTTRTAVLWNAYLSPSTLSAITVTNDGNIGLAGVTIPRVFKPLEYRTLTLTAEDIGPPSIDQLFQFTFDGRPDTVKLEIIGQRARLWKFDPNWNQPVQVDLEFKTDIITSRSRREQRRALRKTPRRMISYTCNAMSATETRVLRRDLNQWQSRPWILGDPTRRVRVPAGAAEGATSFTVDSLPVWVAAGLAVMTEDNQVVEIDSVNPGTLLVTVNSPLDAPLRAGGRIRPALTGLIGGETNVNHPMNQAGTVQLAFTTQPGSEPEDVGAAGVMFGGREVFLLKPNWRDALEDIYNWSPEQIDYGFGRIASFNPEEYGVLTRRATYHSMSDAEVTSLVQFFCRQRGCAGEFHMPSWFNDLPPRDDLVAGTALLPIAGRDTYDGFKDDKLYKAIMVQLRTGERIFRNVVEMSLVSDGSGGFDTAIVVDALWAAPIPIDNILMVSWLPVVRFATDTLTLEFLTDSVAQSVIPIQTLEFLDAETA